MTDRVPRDRTILAKRSGVPERRPGTLSPDLPIDHSRGRFRLKGKEVVLIGDYLHEVKGTRRDSRGQRLVQISKLGRRANELERMLARQAAQERKAARELPDK